jgi:TP901 family phage tail tape measure protein
MAESTKIGTAYVEVEPKVSTDDLEGQGAKAGTGFGSGFSAKMQGLIGAGIVAVGNLLANMAMGALNSIAQFIGDSVAVGKGFDKAMSQVAATMGVTVDEIGDLEQFAQQMGATTAYSATQAAEALNYMALAGYDSEQAMAALPNVLNLAAAGSIDLARASDMVTDAQSALGLSFDDLDGFVDKLAKTSSKTNTSVEQLGDAILTVGGTAKILSGGTTELNTVLGLLANNGIKGAEGGTALRNILLSLSSPTNEAAEELDRLGVSVFDAEGNMRPLIDIMGDFNAALGDMTTEERTQAIATIFNARDLKSVNALLDTNVDDWNAIADAIDNAQGAASAMAETQLDNLAGDTTLFESALEGLQIQIFHGIEPALRFFTQAATEAVGFLSGALISLNEFFFGVETTVDEFDDTICGHAGVLDNFSGVIESVGAVVAQVWPTIQEIVSTAVSVIGEVISYVFPIIGNVVSTVFLAIKGIAETVWPGIQVIVDVACQAISFAVESLQPLIGFVTGIFDGIKAAMENPIQAARDFIKGAIDRIKGFFNFHWKLPDLKLPHIVVGEYIDVPVLGRIPNPATLHVEWYGGGGYVDGATLIGAGERGGEMIWPSYEPWLSNYADALVESMEERGGGDTFIFNITADSETTLQRLVSEAQRARIAYGRA